MKRTLKAAFEALPGKPLFFRALRAIWVPPERIYRYLRFLGPFTVRVDATRKFRMMNYGHQLENDVFWTGLNGGWERVSMDLWMRTCGTAKVIVDVGANTGLFALVASTVVPSARVLALEPMERVIRRLRQNIELNKVDIEILEVAASDQNGSALLNDPQHDNAYMASLEPLADNSATGQQVRTVRMEDLLKEQGLAHVDLLKIDVEGHEPAVVRGMGTLLHTLPTMLVEILSDRVANELMLVLAGFDYRYYRIDEVDGPVRTDRIRMDGMPHHGYNYFICRNEVAKALGLAT